MADTDPQYAPADIPNFEAEHSGGGISPELLNEYTAAVNAFRASVEVLEQKQIDARVAINNVNRVLDVLNTVLQLATSVVSQTLGKTTPDVNKNLMNISSKIEDITKIVNQVGSLAGSLSPLTSLLGSVNLPVFKI